MRIDLQERLKEVSGLWAPYQVTPDQVRNARVGLVVCTGTKAPPKEDEDEDDEDWD